MTLTFTGCPATAVGDTVDLALGYIVPGTNTANMVGYTITPSGQWSEATNLQDEQHLVQIASPFSSDRYGRFPKVSQGDWSGGERQLIFVTGNEYYSSSYLDTSKAGHLLCQGTYTTITASPPTSPLALPEFLGGKTTAVDAVDALAGLNYLGYSGGSVLTASRYSLPLGTTQSASLPSQATRFTRAPDGLYLGTNGNGVYVYYNSTLTAVAGTGKNILGLAYFQGSIWYTDGAHIWSATEPWPATPVQVYTANPSEMISFLERGPAGLVFTTIGASYELCWVYTFDGTTATLLGLIEGQVMDIQEAQGVVYLLIQIPTAAATTNLPVIYQISGSTLSIFDDFRLLDPNFLPPTDVNPTGNLDTDGLYLYLFWSGLRVKRYLLKTGAVYDVGSALPNNALHVGACHVSGLLMENFDDGNLYTVTPGTSTSSTNGVLTTSWFDFGVPDLDKAFDQISFTFNLPTDNTTVNALQVSFQCNNPSATWTTLSPTLAVNSNDVNFYLPAPTIGSRIRFQLTLVASVNPDIQSYSVSATLARTWQVSVSCRRAQSKRQGNAGDTDFTSTQMLANIKNAYKVAGGNVVLFMPDPTIDTAAVAAGKGPALGVSQCYAVLQDYTWTTAPGVSPAYRTDTTPDPEGIEGDCQLVLTEQLG